MRQAVDGREVRGDRLARSGGRVDKGMASCPNMRPSLALRFGGLSEAPFDPAPDRRMETLDGHPPIIVARPAPPRRSFALSSVVCLLVIDQTEWRAALTKPSPRRP